MSGAAPALPPQAWWVGLAGLPGMGPARLRALQREWSGPEAWAAVVAGRAHRRPAVAAALGRDAAGVAVRWARAAAGVDLAVRWRAHAGVGVTVLGQPDHPGRLATDVEPPVVLFRRGALGSLGGPTVAVVGTRRCSRAGAEVAREIGAACARAGVRVVSGLAVGIDSAGHEGALAAGGAAPVAVVGSGLDVVYPARSRPLWDAVAGAGAILSEYPLGTPPARWRFPARNRLVAALADAVVVVESARVGGSMYTVDEALRRDRPVLAVPGPMHSPASAGCNWLLSQGALVVCGPEDVLAAVGAVPVGGGGAGAAPGDPRPRPTGDARRVLDQLGWERASLDALAAGTGLGLGPLAVAIDRLVADGWVARQGSHLERRSAR